MRRQTTRTLANSIRARERPTFDLEEDYRVGDAVVGVFFWAVGWAGYEAILVGDGVGGVAFPLSAWVARRSLYITPS